jgi:phosphoglycerol transferase MdoB-like AlkP superfamily enzyme
MLDALTLESTVAFILAGAVVGVRLLLLSARTRELSDFLVGFSLFDLSAIAYPLILFGTFGDLSLAHAKLVSIASTLSLVLGWGGVFLFTQRVFRSGEGWARALAWSGIAMLAYGFVAGSAFTQRATERALLQSAQSPTLWLEIAAIGAYIWTTFEGFRCWEQSRRRLKLGLADPLVVNRFLLWGCIGVSSLMSVVPSLVITLSGGIGSTDVIARLSTAMGGLLASIALQLAFLPPASYRRWLSRSSAA